MVEATGAAPTYWAFISYSHQDAAWGDWLHRALETYGVPQKLVGQRREAGPVPARLFPVFRDREELPTSADLGANLRSALAQSRALVVICSPRAAESRWVNEEILAFKRLGRTRIFAIIVDGEPNAAGVECFPPALRFAVGPDGQLSDQRADPIAADARPHRDGKANAKLKLLAGLLGVNYDDLKQREAARRRTRVLTAAAVILSVLAAMGGAWQWQRRQAELRLKAERDAREGASAQEAGRQALREGDTETARAQLERAAELAPGDAAAQLMLRAARAGRGGLLRTLQGQPAETKWLVMDPRGRYLLSLDQENHARRWTLADGAMLQVFPEGEQAEQLYEDAMAFSPDGMLMLFVGNEAAYLQEVETGRRVTLAALAVGDDRETTPGHAVFLPDGTVLGDRLTSAGGVTETICARWRPGGALDWSLRLKGQHAVVNADATTLTVLSAGAKRWGFEVMEVLDRATLARRSALQLGSDTVVPSPARDRVLLGRRVFGLDGQQLAVLGTPAVLPLNARWSPSGKLVVTEDRGGTTSVWDGATGALKRTFALESGTEAIDPGDRFLATVSDQGEVQVWDLATGVLLARFQDRLRWLDKQYVFLAPEAFRFTPDGELLVSGGNSKDLKLWAWRAATPSWRQLKGHTRAVHSVHFSADGDRVVTGSADGTARVWSAKSGALLRTLRARATHDPVEVPTAIFLSGGRVLAGSRWDEARVWSADSGELLKTLSFDRHALILADTIGVGASPRGHRLVTLSMGGWGRAWSADRLEPLGEFEVPKPVAQGWLQLSADGARLMVPTKDGRAHVLDLARGAPKELAVVGVPEQSVVQVALSPAGDAVALGRSDGTIDLWTIATGERVALPGNTTRPNAVHFSSDGARLLAACEDDAVRVWRTSGGEPLVLREERTAADRAKVTLGAPPPDDPREPRSGFTVAQFSGDARWVAAGSSLGHVVLWDAATGRQLLRVTPFRMEARVLALEFSPDGARLAASSEDGTGAVVWLGR